MSSTMNFIKSFICILSVLSVTESRKIRDAQKLNFETPQMYLIRKILIIISITFFICCWRSFPRITIIGATGYLLLFTASYIYEGIIWWEGILEGFLMAVGLVGSCMWVAMHLYGINDAFLERAAQRNWGFTRRQEGEEEERERTRRSQQQQGTARNQRRGRKGRAGNRRRN